jgi:hypothetical protein
MLKNVSLLAFAMLIVGCSVALKPGAEKVKVMKSDPAPECQELGAIRGAATIASGDIEQPKNDLRNKAMEKGANYVRIDVILYHPSGTIASIDGTAFKCP